MPEFVTAQPYRLTPMAARRALTYPYDCAYKPMIVTGGGFLKPDIMPWTRDMDTNALLHERYPTLAIGSNRSPRQLARKYADWCEPISIPVWPVWVTGIDVHYAACIGEYGAIPATPVLAPPVTCAMMLVWLTEHEFMRMDETEGLGVAYDRFDVPVTSAADVPGTIGSVVIYRHRAGTIATYGHRSIGMAELPVRNRQRPRIGQRAMQGLLRDRLAPGTDLRNFIAGNIADPALRHRRDAVLARYAIAPWDPDWQAGSDDRQGTVDGKTSPVRLESLPV